MAITTSPDNIPSPTSGDPYNYVVDMAALADRTQEIFTQKANMGVGTSTQRAAALSKFPDGALWYDTTTSSEWRRVAGAWVNQDTGWELITANIQSPWGTSGATPPRGSVVGDVVRLDGAFVFGSIALGADEDVVILAPKYRPLTKRYFPLMTQSASVLGQVIIEINGTLNATNASFSAADASAVRLDNISYRK